MNQSNDKQINKSEFFSSAVDLRLIQSRISKVDYTKNQLNLFEEKISQKYSACILGNVYVNTYTAYESQNNFSSQKINGVLYILTTKDKDTHLKLSNNYENAIRVECMELMTIRNNF